MCGGGHRLLVFWADLPKVKHLLSSKLRPVTSTTAVLLINILSLTSYTVTRGQADRQSP